MMSDELHSLPSTEGGRGGTITEILQYYFLNLTISKLGGAVVGGVVGDGIKVHTKNIN